MRFFEASDRSRTMRQLYTEFCAVGSPPQEDAPEGDASSFILSPDDIRSGGDHSGAQNYRSIAP
jgi:hypothetical protein